MSREDVLDVGGLQLHYLLLNGYLQDNYSRTPGPELQKEYRKQIVRNFTVETLLVGFKGVKNKWSTCNNIIINNTLHYPHITK